MAASSSLVFLFNFLMSNKNSSLAPVLNYLVADLKYIILFPITVSRISLSSEPVLGTWLWDLSSIFKAASYGDLTWEPGEPLEITLYEKNNFQKKGGSVRYELSSTPRF